jgi:peptide deformylase
MKLKIVEIKDPVLRQKARPIKKIDKKIKKLIEDMKETLLSQKDPEGVGLAAPQVGKSLQIFIMHWPEEGIKTKVVVNPRIIKTRNEQDVKRKKVAKARQDKQLLEGCLSLPNYYGPVKRKEEITIEYWDEEGKKKIETFGGFSAHIVQHETDHLKGVVFVDHILKQKAPLYYIKGDEYEEVEI